jgi:hypothetical protein
MCRHLIALLLLLLLLLLCLPRTAAAFERLTLEIGSASAPGWAARDINVEMTLAGAVHVTVRSLSLPGFRQPGKLGLDCAAPTHLPDTLRCANGQAQATLPGVGSISARLSYEFHSATQWTAVLEDLRSSIASGALRLEQTPQRLLARLQLQDADLGKLQPLLKSFGLLPNFTYSGHLSGTLTAQQSGDGRTDADYDLRAAALSFNETSGKYAAEKLDAHLYGKAHVTAAGIDALPAFESAGGQLYVEPIFIDFGKYPMQARAGAHWDTQLGELRIIDGRVTQQQVGQLQISAVLHPADPGLPREAQLTLIDGAMPGLFETYAQPFLAGGKLDPLVTAGKLSGEIEIAGGRLQSVNAHLDQASADSTKLDAGLQQISGTVHWTAEAPAPSSQLRWGAGHAAKLPLGPGDFNFIARSHDLQMTAPLRVPLLNGALNVKRLTLQAIGLPEMGAAFEANIEPIDLRQLCVALGWPEFAGELSGNIPGLTLKDNVVTLDGALSARAFDGDIVLNGLRVIEPFSVVPRIALDLTLRNLDLLAMTGAFSFGRIEGRINGDVNGLRILGGEPVAFDARLYTPPGDDSRHRISQRAIENISSIGGGPTGVLSQGVLRIFKDFPYDRIGWSCRLQDNVCHMDGLGPGPNNGYVLVKGKWLPRIDVIGYSREVNWPTFLDQLQSARNADKVEIR